MAAKNGSVRFQQKDLTKKRLMRKSADSAISESSLSEVPKLMSRLTFKNPGPCMEGFDPEKSTREMRKVTRRIYKERLKPNQQYDERGLLLADRRDLCDCLEPQCPGCHFPCVKCGSGKCGMECRCNRCSIYDEIETEGTGAKRCFPEWKPSS